MVQRLGLLAVATFALACSERVPASGPASAAPRGSTAAVSAPTIDLRSAAVAGTAGPTSPPSLPSGRLIPYLASTWTGKGPAPREYSVFAVPENSPASSYASLERGTCEDELRGRHIAFARAEDTPGVRAPVRLLGPLHGVSFHSLLPPAARARSHADLIDCRLALSLDDFAASIAARSITEVILLSAYRSRAESGCTRKYDGEQHCAALAVDVSAFKRRDGTVLQVERDFHGRIGTLTCRDGTHPVPETPAAKELWDIACSAAGNTFLVVLTPNWNREHKNHMHLELTTHDWVMVR
jgi:hypothetical protein